MTETGRLPPLEPDEFVVAERAEVLLRQVHPNWVDGGVLSSQAFKPTRKDGDKLSVRRWSMGVEAAHRDHVDGQGLASAGTWGISVDEAHRVGTRVIDDSAKVDSPEAHAYVDFRGLSRGQAEKAAKLLRAYSQDPTWAMIVDPGGSPWC